MTLQTRLAPEYTIPSQDVEFFYSAMLSYRDAIQTHRKWVKNSGLPGEVITLAEIDEQLKAISGALLRCFDASWVKAGVLMPVTYTAPEPWPK